MSPRAMLIARAQRLAAAGRWRRAYEALLGAHMLADTPPPPPPGKILHAHHSEVLS